MNAVAAQRSETIKMIIQHEDFQCTHAAQICSPTGEMLSEMFNRDVREKHVDFLKFLNSSMSSYSIAEYFDHDKELLSALIDYYQCQTLKKDLTRFFQNRKTVSKFTDGIEERIAARRALKLPMFVPNEY